jgi:beta-lactamase class D
MHRLACLLLASLLPSICVAQTPAANALLAKATPAEGCAAFEGVRTSGTFILLDTRTGVVRTCSTTRAGERFLPASTFKIANALNALESGLVRDEHQQLKWDGVDRGIPAWNADASLASGMRDSTVWFYQALARGAGRPALQAFVDTLDYGNRDLGGGLDRFWLDGSLRISAAEQVVFLDALRRRALPLSQRSQDTVMRLLERERGKLARGARDARLPPARSPSEWVWRGKTGLAFPLAADGADLDLKAAPGIGWLVGWVERPEGDVVYAMNMDARRDQHTAVRAALTRLLLEANGVLPVDSSSAKK